MIGDWKITQEQIFTQTTFPITFEDVRENQQAMLKFPYIKGRDGPACHVPTLKCIMIAKRLREYPTVHLRGPGREDTCECNLLNFHIINTRRLKCDKLVGGYDFA